MSRQRTVLLVAFHFPPIQGSSGVQRTLRFAQHLPKFGWRPIVLTIDSRAYEATAEIKGNEVPDDLEVHRAFGFNTATQLSLFGHYPELLALPDRWATWRYWAVPKALKIIREQAVDVIWSTFPIASAHSIAMQVAHRAELPWIAEFRDPMWQHDWPPEPRANQVWKALDERIVRRADKVVFVAPSAIDFYAERYPTEPRTKFVLLENGYDEDIFQRAESVGVIATRPQSGPVVLLHSGIVYRSERDPTHFFAAIAAMKAKGAIDASQLQIILRASGAEGNYQNDLSRLGIDDIVQLKPGVDYVNALNEMMQVDGLLLLQASNCNAQVPAKLYEYLRARRPILALTDPIGDTARTLNAANAGLIARLDSTSDIEAKLATFLRQIRDGDWRRPDAATIATYSRQAQAGKLAALLNSMIAQTR